jgi:hypothetical protein
MGKRNRPKVDDSSIYLRPKRGVVGLAELGFDVTDYLFAFVPGLDSVFGQRLDDYFRHAVRSEGEFGELLFAQRTCL